MVAVKPRTGSSASREASSTGPIDDRSLTGGVSGEPQVAGVEVGAQHDRAVGKQHAVEDVFAVDAAPGPPPAQPVRLRHAPAPVTVTHGLSSPSTASSSPAARRRGDPLAGRTTIGSGWRPAL